MNPSPKQASNPSPVPDASGYPTPDSGNISDTVTIEDLEILDASSLGSMSIGPGEIVSDRIIGFAEPSVRFSRKLSAEPNNRFPTEPSV